MMTYRWRIFGSPSRARKMMGRPGQPKRGSMCRFPEAMFTGRSRERQPERWFRPVHWASCVTAQLRDILAGERPYTSVVFFQGGLSFYIRFLRIFLLLIIILMVFSFLYMVFSALIVVGFGAKLVPALVIGYSALLILLLIIFDYTRIITILHNHHKIRHALVAAIQFLINRFLSVTFLYILYLLPLLLLFLFHLFLPGLYQMGIIIAFIYGQLFLLLRSYFRLSLLAGQTVYAKNMQMKYLER